ncbi:hypothetical protein D3C86_2070040 [compost metagenome]
MRFRSEFLYFQTDIPAECNVVGDLFDLHFFHQFHAFGSQRQRALFADFGSFDFQNQTGLFLLRTRFQISLQSRQRFAVSQFDLRKL